MTVWTLGVERASVEVRLKWLNSTAWIKKEFNSPLQLIGKISTVFQPWLKINHSNRTSTEA